VKPTNREWDVSGLLTGFLVGFMLGSSLAMIVGCERKPVIPPGYSETVTTETYEDGGTLDTHREGTGTGAGLTTNSPEVAADWENGSPQAGFDNSSGGDLFASMKLTDTGERPVLAFLGVGLALLAIAGFAVWKGWIRAAIGVGVAAAGMLAASWYPNLLLWVFLAAGGVGGFLLLSSDAARKTLFSTLGRTTEAVEELPDDVRTAVKSQLSARMDKVHKQTVAKVKFARQIKGKR